MICPICSRANLTEQELTLHTKFFHKSSTQHQQHQQVAMGVCPDCGSTLWFQEGCTSCRTCGYSKC